MIYYRNHNIWKCLSAMVCLALAISSCDRSAKKTADEPKQETSMCRPEQNVAPSRKEMLDNQIDHTGFARFEAVELPLAAVLSMIEDKVNSQWSVLGIDKLTFSTINSPDARVTIVLKQVDLRSLINLIEMQTYYQHHIDYDRREIVFLYVGDTIDDDGVPTKVRSTRSGDGEPSVLPPE